MDARDLSSLQKAIAEAGLDAWLFYDFRGSDPIGRHILGLGEGLATRRWYYCLPAVGEPRGLVSAVEPHSLSALPGEMRVYRSWQEHRAGLQAILAGVRTAAMQYSPENAVPYVSRVDAGTLELVRALGVAVVTAADLVQRFEATWTPEQYASHVRAARTVRDVVDAAFAEIAGLTAAKRRCTEHDLQRFILERFDAAGLVTHHPPIVAVGPHSADPHYQPPASGSAPIDPGDFVLIDLWAKEPEGVYADITWTGCVAESVPDAHARVFDVVRRARDSGVEAVRRGLREGEELRGCDIDRAVRATIESAGYAERFVHRTGHSIGTEVHGNGANIDGFETLDTRRLLAHTCFSIEPGIYLPGEFGVRSELNVYLAESEAVVTGLPVQDQVVPILRMAGKR